MQFFFKATDLNNSGDVDPEELTHLLKLLFTYIGAMTSDEDMLASAAELSRTAAAVVFEDADANHDGSLTYAEFYNWLRKGSPTAAQVYRMFDTFNRSFTSRTISAGSKHQK